MDVITATHAIYSYELSSGQNFTVAATATFGETIVAALLLAVIAVMVLDISLRLVRR